jgi:hypothetical protein
MFELFDTSTGNLVGVYTTRDEALSVVQRAIDSYGPESVRSLSLNREDSIGRVATVAQGSQLVVMARALG